jgi:hypothetical protein
MKILPRIESAHTVEDIDVQLRGVKTAIISHNLVFIEFIAV